MSVRTTIHDVARAAGTSISTVSRALNGVGRISRTRRREIIEIARDLDYRPGNIPAERSTATVAVVVQDLTNPFFPELVDGIGRAVTTAGGLVLICAINGWHSLAALRRRRVDGIVLVGSGIDDAKLGAVTAGIPVVALDRDVPLPGATAVRSDHAGGSAIATEHLLDLGHRRIAHVGGPADLEVSELRHHGYRDALAIAGITPDPDLHLHGTLDEDSGYRAAMELFDLDRPPTGIVAVNDLTAIGVLSALEELGRRVPADVSVVGFDDIHLTAYTRPRLTTIHQHVRQLGARAAQLLLDHVQWDDLMLPVKEILPVELVVRESTAAATEDDD